MCLFWHPVRLNFVSSHSLQVNNCITPMCVVSDAMVWCIWLICTLQWCHTGRDGGSNDQPRDCLLNRLFRRRLKTASKLRVTNLCDGNSPVIGEFPAQRASKAENVIILMRSSGICGKIIIIIIIFFNLSFYHHYYWRMSYSGQESFSLWGTHVNIKCHSRIF